MTTNEQQTYKRSYSLADIARKLNRPRTTVQAWRDQFKPYLPTVSGTRGRATRYQVEALALFELIARMKDDNEPPEMIEAALKSNVDFIIVEEEDEDDELPVMAQMYEGLKQVAAAFEEQRQLNDELKKEIQSLKEQQAQEHKELLELIDKQKEYIEKGIDDRDAKLMTTLNKMQQANQEAAAAKQEEELKNKGFFARIFGGKNK